MLAMVAIVFVCIMVAVLALGLALDSRSGRAQVLRDRLRAIDSAALRHEDSEVEILRDELLSEIPALNKLLARWSRASRLQLLLDQAGMKLRPGKFLLICACAGGAAFCALLAGTQSWLLAVAGMFLSGAIPVMVVLFLRRQRFRRFEALFPQAIELLVRSTRAGHPFTTSLEMIGSELPQPVAGEFRRVFEEQKFGLPVRDALLNLAERIPIMDVKFFITALMLQRETGGNLAEILDKLAYVIRERFRILRQVRVYTAQGRMTMIVLMLLPPGLVAFMSIATPDFMRPLFTDPMGHFLIVTGLGLQLTGFLLIRRIIDIKV
jgi:tight adherence protein B